MAATTCKRSLQIWRTFARRELLWHPRSHVRQLCTETSHAMHADSEVSKGSEPRSRHACKIFAVACLQRFPKLSKEKSDLEKTYEDFKDMIKFEKSRLCDYELEEIEQEKNRLEMEKKVLEEELGEAAMLKSDQSDAFDDLKEARETELRQFEPAPRVTEDDVMGNFWSLNRCLDRMLYLVVREGDQWVLPSKEWEGEKSLVETAAKSLEGVQEGMKVAFHSNAPCAYHYNLASTPSNSTSGGKKMFFFKAVLHPGYFDQQDKVLARKDSLKWLSKEELEETLPKDFFDSLSPVLLH